MNKTEQFFELIKKEMTLTLATACASSVTMRAVSPVYYKDSVLIFTSEDSLKYMQLKTNPHCCVEIGPFFAECTAEFRGASMNEANRELRNAYNEKFPGAFDEGVEFGGRDKEFIILKPERLTGWSFADDIPTADGVPTIPFEIKL